MKYQELMQLPNNGFNVASGFYGILNNKILLAGGSGFIKPLADGGLKLLDNSVRLLTEDDGKWIINCEVKIKHNHKNYGFCNGVSLIVGNVAYLIGGLKKVDDQITDSADIIKVWLTNDKLHYYIYENILPFAGEIVGTQLVDNKVFVINGNKAFTLAIQNNDDKEEFIVNSVDLCGNLINGVIVVSDNKKIYLIGGYQPFAKDDKDSNTFLENRLLILEDEKIEKEKIVNSDHTSYVFLGGSALVENNKILIVGGVNKKVFTNAIHNLSTLTGDELENFKKTYFSTSERDFGFNKKLLLLNLITNKLESLGEFSHGFAGNPAFLKWNNSYYILNAEVKAGVRLVNPIKFSL